jgi:hypothetical protein
MNKIYGSGHHLQAIIKYDRHPEAALTVNTPHS